MSDWSQLDILYLGNILLDSWFIHPQIIKENKLSMIKFYKENSKKDNLEKIKKHEEDIVKIDEYLKLF